MSAIPSNLDVERFGASVLHWLGLSFDESRQDFLLEILRRRLDGNGATPAAYLAALDAPHRHQEELRILAQHLTVTETSFFRNPDQIRAFSDVVLPDRISARSAHRRLRILSAGCASGEEAYTLAACVRDCPGVDGWDVSVRGIDVNIAMLGKAAAARYSSWSLRQTPASLRTRLFHAEGRDFVLDDAVRTMVSFEERNLVEDDPAFWQPGSFDIIFCRNVLMYFTPEIARTVIARLARSLTPGGFLFLGHAETLRGLSSDFHLRHTHETFYYQRKDAPDSLNWSGMASYAASLPNSPLDALSDSDGGWIDRIRIATQRIQLLTASAPARDRPALRAVAAAPRPALDLRVAVDLLGRERFSEAQSILSALPSDRAHDPEVLLLSAVLHTHGGNLILAETVCAELLELDELNAGAHYLMALCRESAGDDGDAADHDRIAAYLDPGFAMPRLHLGLLARRAGDREAARRDLRQALMLLQREDSSHLLLFGGGFSRECTYDAVPGRACGLRRNSMIDEHPAMADRAAELREAFDRSFSLLPDTAPAETVSLLGVRVGATSYALQLSEITALFADTRIVPLPSVASEFLGVAALRGGIVPVYSLRALLGDATGDERPRWLVVAGRERVAAFAFDGLEGYLRVPQADISQAQGEAPHGQVHASAVIDGRPRPIVQIRSLIDDLEKRIDPNSHRKEH